MFPLAQEGKGLPGWEDGRTAGGTGGLNRCASAAWGRLGSTSGQDKLPRCRYTGPTWAQDGWGQTCVPRRRVLPFHLLPSSPSHGLGGGPLVFDWNVSLPRQRGSSLSFGDSRPWKVKQQDNKTVAAKPRASEPEKTSFQEETVQSKPRGSSCLTCQATDKEGKREELQSGTAAVRPRRLASLSGSQNRGGATGGAASDGEAPRASPGHARVRC